MAGRRTLVLLLTSLAVTTAAEFAGYIPRRFLHKSVARSTGEDLQPENDELPVDYTGAQLWRVNVDKESNLALISILSKKKAISVWGGNHSSVDVLVEPEKLDNITKLFKSESMLYDVVIPDLQQLINEENPPLDEDQIELQNRKARAYHFWRYRAMISRRRRLSVLGAYMGHNSLDERMEYWPYANWGHRMTWLQYHRVSDIYGFLDYLATTYPAHCSVMTVGKSFEGRDIKVLRISNGNAGNKAVFIDGGIHAREWISPATVTYIINQFAENFDTESEDIQNIDWYFMPVVNPDGYEYTHCGHRLWRKNRRNGGSCSGIDLNRNFGYKWGGKGSSKDPCSDIYGGAHAFSEPESKALADFIKNSAAKFRGYLTFHSYGQYILYPWGYEAAVPPDHLELKHMGEKMAQAIQETGGSKFYVGASSILLYPAAGGSDDWAKGAAGIKYAYTVELNDRGTYGFILPARHIVPVAREHLAAVRVLAKQINEE